jgi:SAM-dependent methyltransferase
MDAQSTDDRVERERRFHDDRYADETRGRAAKYYADTDPGPRRYHEALTTFPAGSRVLEYGCGTGSSGFDLAARGCQVTGIDISPVAIEAATAEAARRGLSDRCRFVEMDAERLTFEPASFDAVCGSGVLHHLDLDRAFDALGSVLTPGGQAVFYEPMGHNPLINAYRRLTPRMRTSDEHPLRLDDFDLARRRFGDVRTEFFGLLSVGGAFVRRLPGGRAVARALAAADDWLFRRVPWIRRWAWVVVLELRQPLRAG